MHQLPSLQVVAVVPKAKKAAANQGLHQLQHVQAVDVQAVLKAAVLRLLQVLSFREQIVVAALLVAERVLLVLAVKKAMTAILLLEPNLADPQLVLRKMLTLVLTWLTCKEESSAHGSHLRVTKVNA